METELQKTTSEKGKWISLAKISAEANDDLRKKEKGEKELLQGKQAVIAAFMVATYLTILPSRSFLSTISPSLIDDTNTRLTAAEISVLNIVTGFFFFLSLFAIVFSPMFCHTFPIYVLSFCFYFLGGELHIHYFTQ